MGFLGVKDKTYLVFGVANKKSVAYHVARTLEDQGAKVIYSVHSESRRRGLEKLLGDRQVLVCDVREDDQITSAAAELAKQCVSLDGIVHSVAYANYENYTGRFHEVARADFLDAVSVSCYSLIAIADAFKPYLNVDASVVAISISTTRMAAEPYGYMAPAKAALDSSVCFLAKSFSRFSKIRFNSVCASLLRTAASAGIPDYPENYLYAEQVIPRKEALKTQEVADAAVFLLSGRSSGINAQRIVVDAGMSVNYFDQDIVRATVEKAWPTERK